MPGNTTPSRYQMGSWTVTRLKDELRNRNLSPVGKKSELITRLEENTTEGDSVQTNLESQKSNSPPEIHSSGVKGEKNINQIREELKGLGMSPVGNKSALLQRLQEAQAAVNNPFVEKTRSTTRSSSMSPTRRKTTPSKSTAPKSSPGPTLRKETAPTGMKKVSDIGLLKSPFSTIMLAMRCAINLGHDGFSCLNKHPNILPSIILALVAISALNFIDGPHRMVLELIRSNVLWYGHWMVLGILSSIGLGTGAHTFLLFLGPFIARVTTAAYVCHSVDFPLTGRDSLLCPSGDYEKIAITIPIIFDKVKWEAFAWGFGTAIGELPPFLIARASAIAGRASGQIHGISSIKSKTGKLTWSETIQLASHNVIYKVGFWGILLCASIPNPLFDLTGITCGYFMIPFYKFAIATLLGKAVFKASIQTAFVIFLFSRSHLEKAISYAQKSFPFIGSAFHEWLLTQRTVFQNRRPNPTMDLIGSAWHAFLILTLCYFMASVIRSAAIMQARRDGGIILQ